MLFDFLTLFPEMFAPLETSIFGRAVNKGIISVRLTNFRDFALDKHKQADDSPFGGGSGMVLKPEPLFRAMDALNRISCERRTVILLDPAGEIFTQDTAKELANFEQLVFICGHYEGYDARIEELANRSLSIGDYVLTGGELAAMVIADAVARMIPGVLGANDSAATDSFYEGILGYPQYTRPREFRGRAVPDVLFSGNHEEIRQWRHYEALKRTFKYRPDLLKKSDLTDEDLQIIEELKTREL